MLDKRREARIRPQLDGLREVLAACGEPQERFPSILVVGTNGKGSTAAMLEAVLRAHGLRTGLFTSPHLISPEERIRVAGRPLSSAALEKKLTFLEAYPELTYFEALTAAAFEVFAQEAVDVAVLEAGMGGTWDATRLARSAIAGLTNVGLDHAAWLGADLEQIAREKGRALEAAGRAVYGSGVPPSLIDELAAPAAIPATSRVRVTTDGAGQVAVAWPRGETRARLPLPGDHQLRNLQLAVALAHEAVDAGLLPRLDPALVREALEAVRWPGRLSTHRVAGRRVLVDCAHNAEAAQSLAAYLAGSEPRFNLLFSCLEDKPVVAMSQYLSPLVGEIAVCPLADERAMPIDQLVAAFPRAMRSASALEALASLTDPILAAGSVRLAGELLTHAKAAVVP
ncbi:MAG: Mur ligase family protein [Acidobacteriota bacterium]